MDGGSSEGNAPMEMERNGGESSQAVVEIKIKTLDSQVYTCCVEQNIPVPALKEQISSLTGIPVENQRLICRGKVLKDDHLLSAYNVEDGHTLHLVTRQAPHPNPPSTSAGVNRGDGVAEESDSHPAGTRNRPGHVSHSVVLGTFNIPDHGDGGMPDVSRIIGSVLNSLGIGNLVPVNTGGGNAGSVTATILPTGIQHPPATDTQGRTETGSSRPQAGVDTGNNAPPSDQSGTRDMEPQFDSVHGLRPGIGFVGTLPAAVPQIRVVQQAMVVPDALTTLSQYLNRMEQVFTTNDQENSRVPGSVLSSSTQTQSSGPAQPSVEHGAARGFPTPAILGSVIRRTHELLGNQAGTELARLASQLENEPNLNDAAARGEVQSIALRDGIMMQHLGALLLELGRATLTLRMGSSPAESAVNAGPAVFISASGPNPMMVQPHPFQPGAGIGALTGMMPQPTAGAMGPSIGATEVPRNINIHIHAGDMGPPPSLQSAASISQPGQSIVVNPGATLGSSISDTRGQGQSTDASNRAPVGNNAPSVQAVPGSIQATINDHGAVRVVPMRTLVAAVPAALHTRPPIEAAGATVGVFYPLLARLQQLNPAQFPQQVLPPQTTLVNGVPMGQPAGLSGTTVSEQHQSSPSASPQTVRAQIQLQAWVPSGGQTAEAQVGSRPANIEGTLQLPFSSSSREAHALGFHQQLNHGSRTDLMSAGQTSIPQQSPVQVSSSTGTADDSAQADNRIQNENGDQDGTGILNGIDVAGLMGPILQQVVEAYQQAGVGRTDPQQLEQVPMATERDEIVDGAGRSVSETTQELQQEVGLQRSLQAETHTEQPKVTDSSSIEMSQSLSVQLENSNLVDSSSSGGLSIDESKAKLQENGASDVPVGLGLGGLQPLPSRSQKRPHKPIRRHRVAGTSGHRDEDQVMQSPSLGDESETAGNRGQNVLQDLISSLASRAEEAGAVRTASGQIPQGLSQLLSAVGNSGHSLGGENMNMGEVLSQIMTNPSLGNFSQSTRGVDQGTTLSSGAFGSVMGQLMQSPFMRNVVQEVMEQVGDEQGLESLMSQGLDSQGGIDLSGMLRQMMPIVSQALGRATGGSENASSPMLETDLRTFEAVEATNDGRALSGAESRKQDELAQWTETVSADIEQQQSTQAQRSASEVYSGGAPVVKRQKMDLEGTVEKLEQGDTPEDILRSVAETASNIMTPTLSARLDGLNFVQQLSHTEGIANEYMALLFQDLAARVGGDPQVDCSAEFQHIFQVFQRFLE